jgi:hypothetical protein
MQMQDEAEGVESIVFNMFTVSQVMAKHIVVISPEATIKKEAAEILAKMNFMLCPFVK